MSRPMGKRPPGAVGEKSKDFKGAMKRLLENLMPWKFMLILSLVLAMISAIIALITPSRLSNLTDTISIGISPKMEVLSEISVDIIDDFNIENIMLKKDLIIKDKNISKEDKEIFIDTMNKASSVSSSDKILGMMLSLPNSIINVLLDDIVVNNKIIRVI